MSEFTCPLVKLSGIEKHPNADSLSLVTVEGCPVVIRTDDWKEGDFAVYVPVDGIVPESVPETEFLGEHRRIKAKRLRGIFSMGLLLPARVLSRNLDPKDGSIGMDCAGILGITKYEEPEEQPGTPKAKLGGKQAVDPKLGPVYDLESYRKYGRKVFKEGDLVVVTEKIHGTNFRFGHKKVTGTWGAFIRRLFKKPPKTEFYVGSHKTWRKVDDGSVYWKIAREYNLEERTKAFPEVCFYGEIYGAGVQDLTYGCADVKVMLFDAWDTERSEWASFAQLEMYCAALGGIPRVPVLYAGPFSAEQIEPLRNGQSTLAKQIREGIVIEKQGPAERFGRNKLKLVGDDYLLRKNGTERH